MNYKEVHEAADAMMEHVSKYGLETCEIAWQWTKAAASNVRANDIRFDEVKEQQEFLKKCEGKCEATEVAAVEDIP